MDEKNTITIVKVQCTKSGYLLSSREHSGHWVNIMVQCSKLLLGTLTSLPGHALATVPDLAPC